MLRAVIFDLDRTLLDRDASVLSFASSQFERFRSGLDHIDLDSYVTAFIRLDARGSVWKDEVYRHLTSELRIRSIAWEELFADFDERIADHYVPFAGLHETLEILSRDFRLGLITNGRTGFQSRTIDTLKIAPFFGAILISEAEGVRKPDPEIFHRALKRLEVSPHEAAYVGDHPISDIKAAKDCGMRAFWKRNTDFPDVTCDGAFDDLNELPALLHNLNQTAKPARVPCGVRPEPMSLTRSKRD